MTALGRHISGCTLRSEVSYRNNTYIALPGTHHALHVVVFSHIHRFTKFLRERTRVHVVHAELTTHLASCTLPAFWYSAANVVTATTNCTVH